MPCHLPHFSVIRFPFDFCDGYGPVPKRFVVAAHLNNSAICIKATSNTNAFQSRPERMRGVVLYRACECLAFEMDTIIDPTNCFAVPHADLEKHDRTGKLERFGVLDDLKERLSVAVAQSVELEPARRAGLLRCLSSISIPNR
jgi:hypothetical protein